MKLYVLPPSPRAFKVIALKNHIRIDCEMQIVDLSKGDQLTPEYVAMNPNRKILVLLNSFSRILRGRSRTV